MTLATHPELTLIDRILAGLGLAGMIGLWLVWLAPVTLYAALTMLTGKAQAFRTKQPNRPQAA